MRHYPGRLREQKQIRLLSIAAILAAIGLSWLSLASPSPVTVWITPSANVDTGAR